MTLIIEENQKLVERKQFLLRLGYDGKYNICEKCEHQTFMHYHEEGACNAESCNCDEYKQISKEKYDIIITDLDAQINHNVRIALDREHAKLAIERLEENKFKGLTSLQIRKDMADYLINMFRGNIDDVTMKGIFRQAYKKLKREMYGKN